MSKITVFFDSCVFFPASVRDLALQLAVDGFYQAKWSELVEEQFVRNVEHKIPRTKGKLGRLVNNMQKAVPDYFAEASDVTIKRVSKSKTDKNDFEILAAAIDSGSSYLVTFNLKDFDLNFARKNDLIVIHPDDFFYQIISSDLERARISLELMSDRTRNPKRAPKDFCLAFRKNQLKRLADLLNA